jgi:hypothetical protein
MTGFGGTLVGARNITRRESSRMHVWHRSNVDATGFPSANVGCASHKRDAEIGTSRGRLSLTREGNRMRIKQCTEICAK